MVDVAALDQHPAGRNVREDVIAVTRDPGAVEAVLADPANRTPDTGGRLSTQQMTEKIMELL